MDRGHQLEGYACNNLMRKGGRVVVANSIIIGELAGALLAHHLENLLMGGHTGSRGRALWLACLPLLLAVMSVSYCC